MDFMETSIKNCLECYQVCIETKRHCLEKGKTFANPALILAIEDCIELCQASSYFMLAGSALHPEVCDVCAEACARCAEACEPLKNDTQIQKCIEFCRICEASCRDMSRI